MAYQEGFPKCGFSGTTIVYADEPILGAVAEGDYDGVVREKWRITVTVAENGQDIEIYNAIVWGGQVFDLQGVMLPYLNWEIDFGNYSVIASGKGVLIKHIEFKATNIADPTVTCKSSSRQVMHARWPKSAGKSLYDYAKDNRIFLTNRKVRYVTPDSPEYLTWPKSLSQQGNAITITPHLKCKVYYSNGSVGIVDKGPVSSDKNISCGFKQLGLDKETNEVDHYEIFLADETNTFVSEKITFVVDYNSYENRRYLVFRNSLGGFDTMLFTGVFDSTFDVNSTTSVNSTDGVVKLKKEAVNVSRVSSAKSGIMPISDLPYIAAEFLTTEKIFLIEGSAITEMILEDGSYKPSGDNGEVVDFEVSLLAANVGDATFMAMSIAAPEAPSTTVTITSHNHDDIYYRKDYVDTELGKRALASTLNTLAADMQMLITTLNAHTHSAAQVTFADGETFQQKLDAGKLKGDKGDKGDTGAQGAQGVQGPKGDPGERGVDGAQGATGADGKTAYQVALTNGFVGTEAEWLLSLKGAKGDKGDTGAQGIQGVQGPKGDPGERGADGAQGATGAYGKTAYQVALTNGFVGTEAEWLLSLKGAKGDKGDAGAQGVQGPKGDPGERGVDGAQGAAGADGKTAYQVALTNGFVGTEAEWLLSLKGAKGDKGDTGAQGAQGAKGDTGAAGKSAYAAYTEAGGAGSETEFNSSLKDTPNKLSKVGAGQVLPAGIATAYDILQKIGIDQNADLTTLLANTSNALFNALAGASKDTLVEIIKWLIENKIDTASTINEWAVGITQPGQKEVMGLLLKMIVSDGSSIVVPIVPQKAVVLTAAGQIQLLNDAYAGKYYVIKNAYLVARNLSGVTQYPTFSIGCNASNYNDIAASQTLNTLVNGVNAIALTANASKALIEANANMVLNITTPIIGNGTFILVLEGVIC